MYKPLGSKIPYVYFSANSYYDHNVTTPFTYTPVSGSGLCIPYMWDANGDGTIDLKDYDTNNNSKLDDSEIPKLYANPKSFQIISGSLDSDYGTPPSTLTALTLPRPTGNLTISKYKLYPQGTGYDANGADDDNLTNFSEKPLGDAKP